MGRTNEDSGRQVGALALFLSVGEFTAEDLVREFGLDRGHTNAFLLGLVALGAVRSIGDPRAYRLPDTATALEVARKLLRADSLARLKG